MGAGGKLPALFLPERRKYEAKKPKKAAGTLFAYLARAADIYRFFCDPGDDYLCIQLYKL
ncbi:hypothetical protein [Marvinbryantia formatexigens]|uniref:hypothetical protein n=1 Tax=Marvinbryantia formatexigens TaxID=168384 RepID=UPI001A9A3C67|nr:hypothetical protein [Marvinbryantia formatexigens]